MFGPPRKPWLWTEKNQKAQALLGLASGSHAKCYELKRCADRVRIRTDDKEDKFEGKFVTLVNFSPCTIKTIEYSFEHFLSINKIVFDFRCLCLNAGHHAISRQKRGIQHRVISSVCQIVSCKAT